MSRLRAALERLTRWLRRYIGSKSPVCRPRAQRLLEQPSKRGCASALGCGGRCATLLALRVQQPMDHTFPQPRCATKSSLTSVPPSTTILAVRIIRSKLGNCQVSWPDGFCRRTTTSFKDEVILVDHQVTNHAPAAPVQRVMPVRSALRSPPQHYNQQKQRNIKDEILKRKKAIPCLLEPHRFEGNAATRRMSPSRLKITKAPDANNTHLTTG
jgi:hypothetical protein